MKARPIVDQSKWQHVFQGANICDLFLLVLTSKDDIYFVSVLGSKKRKILIPTDGSVIGLWSKLVNCPNKT